MPGLSALAAGPPPDKSFYAEILAARTGCAALATQLLARPGRAS